MSWSAHGPPGSACGPDQAYCFADYAGPGWVQCLADWAMLKA